MFAFLTSQHPRCGVNSPVQIIDKNTCKYIIETFVIITINEHIKQIISLDLDDCLNTIDRHLNQIDDCSECNLKDIVTYILSCTSGLHRYLNQSHEYTNNKSEESLIYNYLNRLYCAMCRIHCQHNSQSDDIIRLYIRAFSL